MKCGRILTTTALLPGRPHSAIDEDSIRKSEDTILDDHRITIRRLAIEVKIRVGSMEKTITIDVPDIHTFSPAGIS